MNGKFTTISSLLFDTENPEQLPTWMNDINTDVKSVKGFDLNIQPKGAFAEKVNVSRDDAIGTPREIEASYNETKLTTDAKILLARMLSGKYYKVKSIVNNNEVCLDTTIDGVPAVFKFVFYSDNGKLYGKDTFFVHYGDQEAEYPFSKPGIQESLDDIKNNKIKTAQRVEAVGKAFIISKEEIVRRYSGKLRDASDKINELVAKGDLIGVGSNSFASIYDLDFLFPQIDKEPIESPLPSFEFAPNKEHVAANPFKSANILTIEASKVLAQLFSDFLIKSSMRDNNELLLKVNILTKGIKNNCDFCFGIVNDKLESLKFVEIDNERMTIEQLLKKLEISNNVLNSYLNNNKYTKKIYRGVVLTFREITRKLSGVVKNEAITHIIDNWIERDLICPINSTTYTTNHSFEELLSNINVKTLTKGELHELELYRKSFGEGLDINRYDVLDTGVREYDDIEAINEIRLSNLNHYIAKFFNNFKLENFCGYNEKLDVMNDNLDYYKSNMQFINYNTGVKNKLDLIVGFDGNNVKHSFADINNEYIPLDKVTNLFKKSPLLSLYLKNKNGNLNASSIVISRSNIKQRLSHFISDDIIESTIEKLLNDNVLNDLGNNIYASQLSFEELLNEINVELLCEDDMRQIENAKKYFGEGLNVNRQDTNDTGVREIEEYVNENTLLNAINKFMDKQFNEFKPLNFVVDNDVINYSVLLFDEDTGLSSEIVMSFVVDNNKVVDCYANVNNEKISIDNIKKAFAMNDALNRYLNIASGKRNNSSIILSIKNINKRLKSIANINDDEVNEVINNWIENNKVRLISSEAVASNYTFEQLLSMSNLKALTDKEVINKLTKGQRNKNLKFRSMDISDTGNREIKENITPEKMLLHAKSELNKYFDDYEIIDVDISNDYYNIVARVINSYGIREKLNCKFSLENNLGNIEITNNDVEDPILDSFISDNKINKRQYKNVISKRQLENKLSSVTNENIDKIIAILLESNILKSLSSFEFVTDYSLGEIIQYLSKLGLTSNDSRERKLYLSKKNDREIVIPDKRIYDNDFRKLEQGEKKLSSKMLDVKNKIEKVAIKAHTNKKITNNKFNFIMDSLNNAVTEKDLDVSWKELKKYI